MVKHAVKAPAIVIAIGCATERVSSEPMMSGDVLVQRVASGTSLTNRGTTGVGYLIVDRSGTAMPSLCLDPGNGCLRLAAGSTASVPDEDIIGRTATTKNATLLLWTVVPDMAGRYRADQLREVVLKVR